jgi:hypothetical protein
MYYAQQVALDEKEEHEVWRDRIEYLARFWNNDGVEQVQRARERRKGQTDTAFDEFLATQFGRGLGGTREATVDELAQDIDRAVEREQQLDVVRVVGEDGGLHNQLSSFSPRYADMAKQQQEAAERAMRGDH